MNQFSKTYFTKHVLSFKFYVSRKGFTAIEMLLVVAFIIILLGIAVISLRDQGPKNRNAERRNEVNAIADAISMWSLDSERYMTPGIPSIPTCIGTRGEKRLWSAANDTFVADDPSEDGVNDGDITIDSSGNTYIVWPADYDLYAQKFDINKNPLWGSGVRVNQIITGSQDESSINVDSSGNLYVAWGDSRGGNEIYAQKLDSFGAAQWGAIDKRVNQITVNDQGNPSTALDSGGNFYIAWGDKRNGLSNQDIYAQKLDGATGNNLWGANDVKVNRNSDILRQHYASIRTDSSGSVYAAWSDERNGSSNYDIFAQKLNSLDGSALWSVNDVKVNQNQDSKNQTNPALTVDLLGNIYIAWEDYRGDILIYAQKLNSSGTAQWGAQDKKISLGTTYATHPGIEIGVNGDVYAAWNDEDRDYDDEDGETNDIFAQRLTSSGDILWGGQSKKLNYWNDARQSGVWPTRGNQIAVDSAGNLFAVWFDYSPITAAWGILVQELDARGGCYDLIPYLVPDKLDNIPEDPQNTNGQVDTGYTIYKHPTTKEVIISAPNTENGDPIEARRK